MPFQKGQSGNPRGRQKGVPNKATAAAKSVIAEAAEILGGVSRLVAWAQEDKANERLFWGQIYPRLLPHEVSGPDGGDIPIRQIVNRYVTKVDAAAR